MVKGISVNSIFSKYKIDCIDILKMDIEGAELSVLTENTAEWLKRVRWLLLETHGDEIEKIVIPGLMDAGFTIRRYRNVWYCKNKFSIDRASATASSV